MAANIVAHRPGQGVKKQRIHRKVAAQGIGPLIGKLHAFGMAPIAVSLVFAKGGHLVHMLLDSHQHHAERLAHRHCAREQTLYLIRHGRGGNVKILRCASHDEVAHTAARPKGREARFRQTPNHSSGTFTERIGGNGNHE